MHPRSGARGFGLAVLFLLVSAITPAPPARAQAPGRSVVAGVPGAAEALLAPKSRLPYPSDADVWVDAGGAVRAVVPAPGAGAPAIIQEARVLVFQPRADRLSLERLTALFAGSGILAAAQKPVLEASAVPPVKEGVADPNLNAGDARVYATPLPDQVLVIGLIRNIRSQNQLAFAVLFRGKLRPAQALLEARALVNDLAGKAKTRRQGLPVPPGAEPADTTVRLEGPALRQLQISIEAAPGISIKVKEMARAVIPQATAITRSTWRCPGRLSDARFAQFYRQEAEKLGWSLVSEDVTQSGRPTLLFRRPGGEGVVMVRAEPGPTLVGAATRPHTIVYILAMDGKINVNSLLPK